MKREIKFRGKRIDNEEWIYGYFVKDPQGKCRIHWKPFEEATSNTYHFVDEKTVSQFVGLKDKKGVEIYEGDTLKFNDGSSNNIEWVSKVRFENGSFNVDVENQEYNITSIGFVDDETEYEVINGAS